jgi:2-oxoglutarate dehydrogenase E2 component (dihydrolipoamide succinyltransferase)
MGESIAEGTIVRWIKKVGDKVDRDEPLFEISTDKVDAEIPAPAAGVVSEIRVQEGETVPVNSVVAVIGSPSATSDERVAPAGHDREVKTPAAPATKPYEPARPVPRAGASPGPSSGLPSGLRPATSTPGDDTGKVASTGDTVEAAETTRVKDDGGTDTITPQDLIRQRSSPLVRKIAREHNVDISLIHGSGIAGRVTKDDILGFIGPPGREGEAPKAQPAPVAPGRPAGESDRIEKMSIMRKRIAEHMILSRRTSAHVHSVFEVNFSRIAQIREARKAEFERAGAKLTYLAFIMKTVVDALRAMPIVNSSVDGENIVYHKDINLGIAVALDWGLIVPVIKHADEKNLLGLSRAIADLANRARAKQLKPEEVAGGTFTITNPGVFGALLGTPIINQPQVAILGVGNVEKRPVVVDDAIAIRPMAYLTLGYDHRVIDGAVADQFMSLVKRALEHWDPSVV